MKILLTNISLQFSSAVQPCQKFLLRPSLRNYKIFTGKFQLIPSGFNLFDLSRKLPRSYKDCYCTMQGY